mmetsp:Transcript_17735/g.36525  ORF Transcript_17735/g.36525 Transcript_17735/m.36525 type:complete len:222 (-) Transcript_17735:658-1323(-)
MVLQKYQTAGEASAANGNYGEHAGRLRAASGMYHRGQHQSQCRRKGHQRNARTRSESSSGKYHAGCRYQRDGSPKACAFRVRLDTENLSSFDGVLPQRASLVQDQSQIRSAIVRDKRDGQAPTGSSGSPNYPGTEKCQQHDGRWHHHQQQHPIDRNLRAPDEIVFEAKKNKKTTGGLQKSHGRPRGNSPPANPRLHPGTGRQNAHAGQRVRGRRKDVLSGL